MLKKSRESTALFLSPSPQQFPRRRKRAEPNPASTRQIPLAGGRSGGSTAGESGGSAAGVGLASSFRVGLGS